MTYWHMQLHPNNVINWEKEEELLKTQQIIGIDERENAQSKQFKEDIEKDDVVLIKRGKQPIALVQIVDDKLLEHNQLNDDLNWFKFKRKIRILDFFNSQEEINFNIPAYRLSKSVTRNSDLFKFIDAWYKQVITKEYVEHTQETIVTNQYKIKSLFINDFKMFKDFNLSFSDNDGIPLPLVVIAGKNGTGKTTILKYLSDYNMQKGDYIEIFQTRKPQGLEEWEFKESQNIIIDTFKLYESFAGINIKKTEYREHIEYLPVTVGNIGNVEEKIVNYYITNAEELDSFKESLKNIQKYINNIFKNLELNFNVSKIDYKEKKVFLKNKNNKEFSIEELSTGEKTLVSKVLYLYFNEIKNKIILIDEPELSLHPSWQNKILKQYESFAIENNCQVIIATHSPNIIANTAHKYIKILYEENNKIVAKSLNHAPLDRDLNTIIKTIMGADYIPQYLKEKHEKYRNLCMHGEENCEEAKKLKSEILEYESPNSSFFQGLAFDLELMK